MRHKTIWTAALICVCLAVWPPPKVKAQATPATPPAEPDPMVIMRQMCDYLNSLQQFWYHSEVTDDQVYYGGKKLQYGIEMDTYVKRPDKLRVDAEGDLVDKQFFFNGKTITLYDRDEKVYATMEVPPSIEGALDKAHKDFGLKVALTDLASPQLWEHVSKGIEHSLYVGLHKVRGIPCHHLALDRGDLHIQVWIDAGDRPLPQKIVFLHKQLEGSPQWTAYLSGWDTSAQFGDSLFNFMPPSGVHKIKFVPVKQPDAQGKKKGGQS
ncbi:MAG: DUF2092 domain-containing protein [Syntrophobacteraceae bacterium]